MVAPVAAADDPRHRYNHLGRYDVIHDFDSTSATGGRDPYGLTKTSDGAIFGMSGIVSDAPEMVGAVYRLLSNGETSIVHYARHRPSALIGARSGGVLYGTVMLDDYANEPRGCGELYRLERSGRKQRLFSFSHDSPLGCYLAPHLVEADDGSLIGSTRYEAAGSGAMYRVAPDGTAKVLYNFGARVVDGPGSEYAVTLAMDGTVYALSQRGIFRIEADATATPVVVFDQPTVGVDPSAGMIRGVDGGFYGANGTDGPFGRGTVFRFDSTTGGVTLLHAFSADQSSLGNPESGLLLASDGYLYGGTSGGVYRLRTDGSGYEELVRFHYGADGYPSGALVETSTGDLLGARNGGGLYRAGFIYRLRQRAATNLAR